MRRYAVLTLSVSGGFLMFVGVWLNSAALFYMSTVMIVTLIALKAQAILATKGLRFERIIPSLVTAGERIEIRIRVWSTIRMRRPLLVIVDEIPNKLTHESELLPLPIAPVYDEPIETRYQIRPTRRGVFRWSSLRVISTDSLGILSTEQKYETAPAEIIVHPAKIPFTIDLAALSGWSAAYTDDGKSRGPGMEARGVREYSSGDPLRHVHWRSTARKGQLMVKEFDAGFTTNVALFLQLTKDSEIGEGGATTLEAMCSHAAFLADEMLNRGSPVLLPALEGVEEFSHSSEIRYRKICDALAKAEADRPYSFASEIERCRKFLPPQCTVVLMIAIVEPGMDEAIRLLTANYPVVVYVYDANSFARPSQKSSIRSATEPHFLASIAAPRVAIRFMPNPFEVYEKSEKYEKSV